MSQYVKIGGVTAYALAVKNGFTGTEAEWLESLSARIGENGNWWVGDKDLGVLADPAQLQELTGRAAASADAAGKAAGKAGLAAEAAETARSGAESAQSGAVAAQEAAKTAQQDAEKARDRAEAAAVHQPIPNAETRTWWVWDSTASAYVDSGEGYSATDATVSQLKDDIIQQRKNIMSMRDVGINLFDMNSFDNLDGYLWNNESLTMNPSATYGISHFIPVIGGETYYGFYFGNQNTRFAEYDSEFNVVNVGVGVINGTVTFQQNTQYVRFCYQVSLKESIQLELGSAFTGYHPYTSTKRIDEMESNLEEKDREISQLKNKTSEIEPGVIAGLESRVVPYSNIFNKNDVELGYKWNATTQGVSKVSYNGWCVLKNPVKLKANTTYFIKGFWLDKSWTPFYKSDGTYDTSQSLVTIESLAGQWHGKWTVGSEDCLINVSVDSAYLDKAYISEVYDEYKPYMGIDYSPLAKELSDKVDTIVDILPDISNILNKNDIEEGKRWYATTSSVQKTNDSNNRFSVLNNNIRLKANTTYYAYGMWNGLEFTPLYDVDGNYDKTQSLVTIENIGTYHYRYIVGNNDCYINVTLLNSEKNKAYISEYADFYVDYGNIDLSFKSPYNTERIQNIESDISNKLTMYDKKVLVVGDSISVGRTSPIQYLRITNWVDCLCDEGFFDEAKVTNSSIHATGFRKTLSEEAGTDFYSRIQAIESPESYDVVILFGGINNFIGNSKMDDFKAGVDEFFAYVVEHFINARFLVISPLHAFANWQGSNQSDYTDYIKFVTKSYGLPLLNATDESGWMPHIEVFRNKYSIHINNDPSNPEHDGVHPTTEYNKKFLAPYFKGFLRQFI